MSETIIPPRRKAEFFDQNGDPTFRFIKWMELVTRQTNTVLSDSENSAIFGLFGWPEGDQSGGSNEFNYQLTQQDDNQFRAVTATSSYTALPFDFVNAKNGAAITFPKYPSENSVIIIRNGDGTTIDLLGKGKIFNGS